MRIHPIAVALCTAGLLPLAACSQHQATSSTPTASATSIQAEAQSPAPGADPGNEAVGISPGGVTTRVDAPEAATESGYGQACLAAKTWFDTRGGDPKPLVEEYLKTIQDPAYAGLGTFDQSWAELTAGEQSAVIMAVGGAADGLCG